MRSHPEETAEAREERSIERGLKRRLAFIFASLCCLLVATAIYLLRPGQAELAAGFALASALIAGFPVFAAVFAGFRTEIFGSSQTLLEQFIALAIIACIVAGQFFLASIVAIILVLGQMLEDRSMLGTRRAVEGLIRLGRVKARRVDPDGETAVEAEGLKKGDQIRVLPGDRIAADARIVAGLSSLDTSPITGESLPVEVQEGDEVFAGTTNLSGTLLLEVTSTGKDTVIGQASSIVEDAQKSRAPILRLTESYAGYYFPLVLMLCGFVLFFTGEMERAIAVLIVSLPCAFLLAAPTAMVAALASATRLGILIKGVRYLEEVRRIDTLVFDKTGTLTQSRLRLSEVIPHSSTDPESLLRLAASALAGSNHPIARACVEGAAEQNLDLQEAVELEEFPGLGVEARVDRASLAVGRKTWMEKKGVFLPPEASAPAEGSEIHVVCEGQWIGRLLFQDTLRPEAAEVVSRLAADGNRRVLMVTGDRPAVARKIADEIGIEEVHAGCLPEDKLRIVEALREEGRKVLVIGDGINDAPALAAGHVSLAMGAMGNQIAIQAADMALMGEDLHKISDLLRLSRATMNVVSQNLIFGCLFIMVAIIASAFGWVGPIGAAILHEVSAFVVLLNSGRLLRFE